MKFSKSYLGSIKKRLYKDKKATLFYLFAIIFAAVPLLIIFVLILQYSANTPFWDQLSFIHLMEKLHNGSLSFYDLWIQHNEHRLVVPQALELLVGSIIGFDFRAPVIMSFIFAIGTLGLLVSMMKRTGMNTKLVILLSIVTAWLLFSTVQSINWVWGFQLVFFMCVFFVILTIWLLTRSDKVLSKKLFVFSVISAIFATYCVGNGLLMWPIGFAILLLRRERRIYLMTWAGTSVAVIASYLYHFHRSLESPPISEVIKEPVLVSKYVFIYLGRSIATTPDEAYYTGIALLIVFLLSLFVIYKKKALRKIIPWVAIVAFVVMTALLAAASRLNFGYLHSFDAVSYTTISILFVITVVILAAFALKVAIKSFTKKNANAYIITFFIAGTLFTLPIHAYITNYTNGIQKMKEYGAHFQKVKSCINTAVSSKDSCLSYIHPDKKYAWTQVQFLRESGWSDFGK